MLSLILCRLRSKRFHCVLLRFLLFLIPTIVPTILYANDKEDKQPIDITSDNANFDDKTGNTTYQGNVHASQGARHLWANVLIIHRSKEGKIDHIIAEGSPARFNAATKASDAYAGSDAKAGMDESVQLTASPAVSTKAVTTEAVSKENITENTSEIRGKANHIHYYPKDEKIIFLQNAELAQEGRLIRGDHLIYFINNRTLISESSQNSRTVVIIQPKSAPKPISNSTSNQTSISTSKKVNP